jgi:hypothetical protein
VIEINRDLCCEEYEQEDVGKWEEAEPVNPLAAYSTEELEAEIRRRETA